MEGCLNLMLTERVVYADQNCVLHTIDLLYIRKGVREKGAMFR